MLDDTGAVQLWPQNELSHDLLRYSPLIVVVVVVSVDVVAVNDVVVDVVGGDFEGECLFER